MGGGVSGCGSCWSMSAEPAAAGESPYVLERLFFAEWSLRAGWVSGAGFARWAAGGCPRFAVQPVPYCFGVGAELTCEFYGGWPLRAGEAPVLFAELAYAAWHGGAAPWTPPGTQRRPPPGPLCREPATARSRATSTADPAAPGTNEQTQPPVHAAPRTWDTRVMFGVVFSGGLSVVFGGVLGCVCAGGGRVRGAGC